MNGRSVLYVPGVAEQKRLFIQTASANEMKAQVLDVSDEHANAALDKQLIAAVGFQPGVATQRFDQLADELVGVRSRLTRYLGDLHGGNDKWNVSAYETIQNLARISVLPTHPATHVRLDESSALSIANDIDTWIGKMERAGELGEYTIGPEDTAWYKASITTEEQAVTAYQRVDDLLRRFLPATREQVARTVQTCGFPVPPTTREWERQVTVLKNLRRVLDVFQPEIFERDISSMIEATKPKSQRKAEGTSMGFWERRRHIKEAKDLLRVGAQVEDLPRSVEGSRQARGAVASVRASRRLAGAAQQARRDHLHPRGAGQQYDRAGYRAFHHTRWWQSGNRRFREGGSTPESTAG